MNPITPEEYKKVSKEIMQGYVDVNARYALEGFGELSIFHIALYFDDYNFINYLLDHQVNVTVNEESCGTPLHLAVSEKIKYTTVWRILDAGADVNAQDSRGNTALHLAVEGNRYKVAQLLLDFGSNIDAACHPTREFDTWTPLDLAIIGNKLELVNLLLTYESDIDCKSKQRYPPLVIASLYGTVSAVEIILRKGADVNFAKDSGFITECPLQAAVASGDPSKVKHLLRNINIQVNKRDVDGDSSLHYAMSSPSDSCLQYLLDAGADVNLVDGRGHLPINSNDRESGAAKKLHLQYHLVKLEAAGCQLVQNNLDVIQEKEYKEFSGKCEKEIKKLKQTPVGRCNFTFFSILRRSDHWLAKRLMRMDEGILINSNIRKVFPLYGNMIHQKIKMASNRKQLLINVEELICDVLQKELPDTFLRCLSDYFSNKELEIMNGSNENYSLWV